MTEIRVPTLGESVTEATVATWFKKPGDSVAIDEMLCELETDKVTVEVPSTVSGILSEIIAHEGETVGLDAMLGIISEGGIQPTENNNNDQKISSISNDKIQISNDTKDFENAPSAKKLMNENKINEKNVVGTGRDGRVMKEDVLAVLNSESSTNRSENQLTDQIQEDEVDTSKQQERINMSR